MKQENISAESTLSNSTKQAIVAIIAVLVLIAAILYGARSHAKHSEGTDTFEYSGQQ